MNVYMDNAATTMLSKEVYEKMQPYFMGEYGNASGIYSFAQRSRKAVEDARQIIGDAINAKSSEIYFTSGGTESDNWALKAVADAMEEKGRHIITTKIEHHAILNTCGYLEKKGFRVTYLDVDSEGRINLQDLENAIENDTILISVMFANNEIGTIQPVKEIGEIAHRHGIIFHTDAVQAFGHVKVDVEAYNIDMLSASAHKFHGPKGAGFLYIRNGIKIGSYMHGGSQERHRRAGTLNVPGIVGMGEAARIAVEHMDESIKYETDLREYFIGKLKENVPHIKLNGSSSDRLPDNINVCFKYAPGESALIMLDRKEIYCSAGSACTSGAMDASHVLLAIGMSEEMAHCSIRFTISSDTTKEDIDYVVENVSQIITKLRAMSPLYEHYVQETEKQ